MWVKNRHKIVFRLLTPILRIYFRLRYNMYIKKYKNGKGPFLVLANHSTTMDPFYIGCMLRKPVYYMASEDLFNKGFASKIIKYLVAPIPKSKSIRDSQAVRDCFQVRKEGGTICIFPEGNRTYSGALCNIDPSIGKLAKKLDMTILLVNIRGGFQTDPRFSNNIRKGKMVVETSRVITKDELEKIEVDELNEIIIETLKTPLLENIKYKSKRKAEYIERVFYYCPECNSYETIVSDKDYLSCNRCGFKLRYNEFAKFELIKGNYYPENIFEYYSLQENILTTKNMGETLAIQYSDELIQLFEVKRAQNRNVTYIGKINLVNCNILFGDEIKWSFEEILAMTVVGKNKLNVYLENQVFQIKGDVRFSALKYMHVYYHYMNLKKAGQKNVSSEFLGL